MTLLISVVICYCLRVQNLYFVTLVAGNTLFSTAFRMSSIFYGLKLKDFITFQTDIYVRFVYWNGVLAYGFALALFYANVSMETFDTFFHLVECLDFGFCYSFLSIMVRYLYLKSVQTSVPVPKYELNALLYCFFVLVLPCMFLYNLLVPLHIYQILGVVRTEALMTYGMFASFEAAKATFRHFSRQYAAYIAIAAGASTMYHRYKVHPTDAVHQALAAELASSTNNPDQRAIYHSVFHKFGTLHSDGTMGTRLLAQLKLDALKKDAAVMEYQEFHPHTALEIERLLVAQKEHASVLKQIMGQKLLKDGFSESL